MKPRTSPFRLEPESRGRLLRPIARLVERLLGLNELDEIYQAIASADGPDAFVRRGLEELGVEIDIPDRELERVPTSGPAVVVANHPFGGIDGLIAMLLLRQVRSDVRVLANSMLSRIEEIRPLLIPVDPFGGAGSEQRNRASIREALRFVEGGGLLLVFPAGEVAHRTWTRWRVTDPAWQPMIARIVQRTGASVTPMFLGGHNGNAFQFAGLLHPRLRTALLARQLKTKGGRTVPVRVGKTIPPRKLEQFEQPEELIEYLRLRTEIVGRRLLDTPRPLSDEAPLLQEVASEMPTQWIEAEVAALPDTALMAQAGANQVWLASAQQIPMGLQEIGRLREIAFREVGEGTGRARDNDDFDRTYKHLFVWNTERKAILGSYRIGLTDELMRERGPHGLYTHTLFRYDARFLEGMAPALELGRSFVRSEEQRSYIPLMLLWRGIGGFVAQNPRYKILFGPVSISSKYDPASLQLMVDHLKKGEFRSEFADLVEPRNPVQAKNAMRRFGMRWTPSMLADLDQVSAMIAEIEKDAKGVPVLVKEYLKLGGKIAGFNVDAEFNDAVDGLVIVDLRETAPRILNRYLGEDATAKFLASA